MALALLALLLSLAVLLRLTARFIQSRWRTAVFALCLLGGMAAQFYLGVEPSWQPVVTAPTAGADPGSRRDARWRAFVPVGV